MKLGGLIMTPPERQLLAETRLTGPVPWMLAIMMLMTILAGAAFLSIGNAVDRIGAALAGRVTIQLLDANPDQRERERHAVIAAVRAMPDVRSVHELGAAEMARLLKPWLGSDATTGDLPIPTMIDVSLAPTPGARRDLASRVQQVAPGARVDDNAAALAPVAMLLNTLRGLAAMVMGLMALSMVTAIVLAVRGGLNTHRQTIDVMHLMGSTDAQIATHFQRRSAIDALLGGAVGLAIAVLVLLLVRRQVDLLGSGLASSGGLGPIDWLLLLLLPVASGLIAGIVARMTVIRALRKIL